MRTIPHDLSDLHFAPVVLAIDARVAELSRLGLGELADRIAVETNRPDWSREVRVAGLLEAITNNIDTHRWAISWKERGIQLAHEEHCIVLGVPASFAEYLSGVDRVADGGVRV
ncbi:MAG TPA: hypothetical protein VGN54_06815 [Mycobacteriales bacterium]|jgi:hypothetical protein|nr:hypothetical protein [Mycobacteriales bacterium]